MHVGQKILIVEDDRSLNMALREKLDKEGYETFSVDDGEKGLNASLNVKPDCIILDLMMPQMSGMEMLKKLRQHHGCETIPVIVLTNVANSNDIEVVTTDPEVMVFVKSDTSLADILVVVRKILERQ